MLTAMVLFKCIWSPVVFFGVKELERIIHMTINNRVHEIVGSMPTVAAEVDFVAIKKAVIKNYKRKK